MTGREVFPDEELRRRIMDDCFWHGIAIMLKPDMQDIMVNCADTVIMRDVPLCLFMWQVSIVILISERSFQISGF